MSTSFRKLMADRRAQKRFFDEVRKHNEESQFIYDVEVSKRRAKGRVRQRKAVESHYWQQVWKILGITMFWGAILAIVLAAIVCSIDFIWRLFL